MRTYENPIVKGSSPDPSIVNVDGQFFLVNSSFHLFPGIPVYTSRDLVSWQLLGNAINRPEMIDLNYATTGVVPFDQQDRMTLTGGLLAPTIRYHKGTFYVVCCNGSFKGGMHKLQNFFLTTKDIWSNNWSDPIFFDFPGFDTSIFFDDDDRAYIQGAFPINSVPGTQPSFTISQFEIDASTGNALSEIREIWPGHVKYDTEGPHIYKKDGYYYVMAAEGGTFEKHCISIARSESIWGPYENCPFNPVLTAYGKNEYIQNTGHGDLFQDTEGRWWAVLLGVRNFEGTWPLSRESFLTAVEWPEGGWPQFEQPRMSFEREGLMDQHRISSHLHTSEELENTYIRTPNLGNYDFPSSSSVVLKPSEAGLACRSGTCTFIGRRQRTFKSTATVTLTELRGSTNAATTAGLALYKDPCRYASVAYDFSSSTITFTAVGEFSDTNINSTEAKKFELPVVFKIVTSEKEYKFYVREESGAEWLEIGQVATSRLAGRDFSGSILGIFAAKNGANADTAVAFDNFQVASEGE